MEKAHKARELVESRRFGCLSTQSARHPGFPFVSIAEYAASASGEPVFLFSGLAIHTRNLAADARASLIVFAPEAEQDTLGSARVTLMGEVGTVPEAEVDEVRAYYLARHPQAEQWVGFGDFAFYRMAVGDIYYVGGFGAMGWVSGGDYHGLE
jgi:heme iron utilization protein